MESHRHTPLVTKGNLIKSKQSEHLIQFYLYFGYLVFFPFDPLISADTRGGEHTVVYKSVISLCFRRYMLLPFLILYFGKVWSMTNIHFVFCPQTCVSMWVQQMCLLFVDGLCAKWANSHKLRENSQDWACSSWTFSISSQLQVTNTRTDAWRKNFGTFIQPVSH